MNRHHVKTLMLLRHAKAAWPAGVTDHDRPLAQRGHQEAPMVGAWMVENDRLPDYILCSSALRTRQTCTWICQQLGDKAPTPKLEDRLYEGPVQRILSLINHVPDTVQSLLVIGHNPSMQSLALRLASPESDEEAVTELALRYPTSGLTVMEHGLSWSELDQRDARVTDFVVLR